MRGSLAGPAWSKNNQAHVATYKFFRFGKTGKTGYMYSIHHDLGFAGSSELKLRQMQYWNKEHEDPAVFGKTWGAHGPGFDKFLTSNGVAYEQGVDKRRALSELSAAFAKGRTTFAQLAATCDRLYRFGNEDADL